MDSSSSVYLLLKKAEFKGIKNLNPAISFRSDIPEKEAKSFSVFFPNSLG
jgi:hypothetical protein